MRMFLQIFRKKWVTYSLFELNNPVRFFGLLCFLLVAFEVLGQHALRLNSRYVLDLSKDTVVERGLSSESPNVKTINLPFEDFARGLQFQYSADKVQTPDFSLPCSKLTTNHGIKKSVYLPVFLPNAISPNEDGINDAFRITQLTEVYDVIQLNFRAYDYRGVLFYESTSPSLEGLADLIATDKGPLFTYQLTFETIDRSLYQKYGVVQIIR